MGVSEKFTGNVFSHVKKKFTLLPLFLRNSTYQTVQSPRYKIIYAVYEIEIEHDLNQAFQSWACRKPIFFVRYFLPYSI